MCFARNRHEGALGSNPVVHIKTPTFTRGEILLTVAVGLALVAGVLGAVTAGITWASQDTSFSGFGFSSSVEINYQATGFESCSGGCATVDYTDESLDGTDGIGLMRAAGPLLITGIVVTFVAMATLAASLFVRGAYLCLSGSIAATVGFVLLLLALIFLPVGLDQATQESDLELTWGAGLVLACIGTASALAGAALGWTTRFGTDRS